MREQDRYIMGEIGIKRKEEKKREREGAYYNTPTGCYFQKEKKEKGNNYSEITIVAMI